MTIIVFDRRDVINSKYNERSSSNAIARRIKFVLPELFDTSIVHFLVEGEKDDASEESRILV